MVIVLGIDDSGRGPVAGPMILAGVLLNKEDEKQLKKFGVTDSKQLTQKRREFLEVEIKKVALGFHVVKVSPTEIDDSLNSGTNLNEVEALACAKIINKLNNGKDKIKVYVDCPSTSIAKWSDSLKQKITTLSNLEVSCEHKADKNHVSVSAASILAKCEREREMAKLRKKYGEELGSGYTSDPLTQQFLKKYAYKYRNEGIFRKTWETWKKLYREKGQMKLGF